MASPALRVLSGGNLVDGLPPARHWQLLEGLEIRWDIVSGVLNLGRAVNPQPSHRAGDT